jgi:5-dehydro-2-deoxygluconokinase
VDWETNQQNNLRSFPVLWHINCESRHATGALVVTKQGCANFMPTEQEALDFIESQGGF